MKKRILTLLIAASLSVPAAVPSAAFAYGVGSVGQTGIKTPAYGTGAENKKQDAWLSTVKKVKKAASKQCGIFDVTKKAEVKIAGRTYRFRPDASGFVSLCLNAAGISDKTFCSRELADKSTKIKGFKRISWNDGMKLKAGDIIVYNGNTVIFSRMKDKKKTGYSWGSKKSAKTAGENILSDARKPVCILRAETDR